MVYRLLLAYVFLNLLFLFPSIEAMAARGSFFSERAYLDVGSGVFQCEGFKETKDEYLKNNLRISHVFNIGIGYKFSDRIRSAINFQYSKINYKASDDNTSFKQQANIVSSIINLYYNIYSDIFTKPYITAGVGMSRNQSTKLIETSLSMQTKGKIKINLAWNIGCGILLDTMSRDYSIDIGYKYIDLGEIQTNSFFVGAADLTQKIRGHQGTVSVLFQL